MSKELDKLQSEVKKLEAEKLQTEHALQLAENRLSYREKFSRKERTHRLIVTGAIFEQYLPEIRQLSEPQLSEVLSRTDLETVRSEILKAGGGS